MACPTFTLTGVTEEVWECVRRKAVGLGLSVPPGERGTIHHKIADAEFAWDAAAATLEVTFTRSPAWIGCRALASRVRKAAAACGAA